MIGEDCQTSLESIIALNMTLNGNLDPALTDIDSERNLSKSLVSISTALSTGNTQVSIGSGLMITTNGFILTAYHNIKGVEEEWKRIGRENLLTESNKDQWMREILEKYYVKDQNGNSYPIDITFWGTNPDYDVALIKAVLNKRPRPIKFKVLKEPLQNGDEIRLVGFKNHALYTQLGKVTSNHYDAPITDDKNSPPIVTYDTFLTDAYSVPGFSGGVFIDMEGRLAGLSVYGQKSNLVSQLAYAGGAKYDALDYMIKNAAYSLGKRQLES